MIVIDNGDDSGDDGGNDGASDDSGGAGHCRL